MTPSTRNFDRSGTQTEIDETSAGDCRWFAEIVHAQMHDDLFRQSAGIFAALFSQHKGGVGLIIAKARIGRLR